MLWPFALAAALGVRFQDVLVDDAFIYLNTARSLLHGGGWAFNPGEPANAITGPTWLLVLLALEALWPQTPLALVAVYGFCMGLLGAGVDRLAGTTRPVLGLMLSTVALLLPVAWVSVGMETAFALATAAWALAAGPPLVRGALMGLATGARPDFGLLVVVLVVHEAWVHRRLDWRFLGAWGALVLPWVFASLVAFGTPIPETLSLKQARMALGLGFDGTCPPFAVASFRSAELAVPSALLAAVSLGLRSHLSVGRDVPLRALVLFGPLQAMAYTVLGLPCGFHWYFAPLHLSLGLGAVLGGWALYARAAPRVRAERAWLLGALGCCAFISLVSALAVRLTSLGLFYSYAPQYLEVAEYLRRYAPTTESVAASEIGYLGYFGRRPVVDIHGLVHPSRHEEVLRGRLDGWLAQCPDWVVTHVPPWDGEPGAETPLAAFEAQFERTRLFVEPSTQRRQVLLWRRTDVSVPCSPRP